MMRQLHRAFHRDERGQIAIGMVIGLLMFFAIFGVAFDAGLWYFDHRTAQNQAEAAALAGAQALADTLTQGQDAQKTAANAAIEEWLNRNGSSNGDLCDGGPDYAPANTAGSVDTVTVCLRRQSKAAFTMLPGIPWAWVSASATAKAGRVTTANVMPWSVVPPDPTCQPGGICSSGDVNGDGDDTDTAIGECYDVFAKCPWGLSPDRLFAFKSGGGGNTGIVDACGGGATSYRDCIEGTTTSGFFTEGDTVYTGLQGGNLGRNTASALADRYPSSTWGACDVASTPDPLLGYDPDGKQTAIARFVDGTACSDRLVIVPILASLPPQGGGSADIHVLGIATFGIAKWNRDSNKDTYGRTGIQDQCSTSVPDTNSFACGMVWGYLIEGASPPDFLLQQISDSDNPFAPILVALVN